MIAYYYKSLNLLAEAEQYIRQAITVHKELNYMKWRRYQYESELGQLLLEQGKLPEAERVLVAAYNGLLQSDIPYVYSHVKFYASLWLEELYRVTNRPELAESIEESRPLEPAPLPRFSN